MQQITRIQSKLWNTNYDKNRCQIHDYCTLKIHDFTSNSKCTFQNSRFGCEFTIIVIREFMILQVQLAIIVSIDTRYYWKFLPFQY